MTAVELSRANNITCTVVITQVQIKLNNGAVVAKTI